MTVGADGTPATAPGTQPGEPIAGYYTIKVADLDAAIGWAAQVPVAGKGTRRGSTGRRIRRLTILRSPCRTSLQIRLHIGAPGALHGVPAPAHEPTSGFNVGPVLPTSAGARAVGRGKARAC